MKYEVRLAGLTQCYEDLEHLARNEWEIQNELGTVIRKLNSLAGMQEVSTALRREQEEMNKQMQATLIMAHAAARIQHTYQNMENNIIDDLDCPAVHIQDVVSGGGALAREDIVKPWVFVDVLNGRSIIWHLSLKQFRRILKEFGVKIKLAK